MTITTSQFIIKVNGNLIICEFAKEQQINITSMQNGAVNTETKSFSQAFNIPQVPCFTARYDRRYQEFDMDIDCGAQRWEGPKTVKEVQQALVKCGLNQIEAKNVVRTCGAK